jgi:ankyrin repeat protein
VDDSPDPDAVELAHRMFDLAREGRADELATYLDAGVPVELTDAAGNSLLMLAAYHGHATVVRALAERGADVDHANDRGQTPLAGAVFKGEDDVIAALLEREANPAAGHPSAIETARFFGHDELAARLAARH